MTHSNVLTTLITTGLVSILASSAAQATLIVRGGGLIYDTDLNVTWLTDANYAATQFAQSGGTLGDGDGRMNWSAATAWAANLSYYDSVRNVTYTDWRLPTTLQPDASCDLQSVGDSFGLNCTGSEMGHLFYVELGGTAGQSILTSADPDLAKFTNLRADFYWSDTEYTTDSAWYFRFNIGFQDVDFKSFGFYSIDGFYVLAVRPGDVAAVNGTIPEPQTLALLGLGLGGMAFARRRKARPGVVPETNLR